MYINTLPAVFPAAIRAAGSHPGISRQKAVKQISAIFLGQSELVGFFSSAGFYNQIDPATPADGNLIVYRVNTPPERVVVNATTAASGEASITMCALSAFLNYVRPGYTFVVGSAAVAGTGRADLIDDEEPLRSWADFENMIYAVESESGRPVSCLIECWYNTDASSIINFIRDWWPSYFGVDENGDSFTLGVEHSGYDVDHCIWDADADANDKGRGVLARGETKWHILTPMPFHGEPVDPVAEWAKFDDARLAEPDRAVMDSVGNDAIAQSVGVTVGVSAHICKFGGGDSEIHPDVASRDGHILLMYPFALALLRQSGMTITEPEITGIEGPEDGSYVDVVVSLPNGGNLTTIRALRGDDSPAIEPPHYQDVIGFEITRATTRHPIYKSSETSYDADFRGLITITDAGSGNPRTGTVRIVPENNLEYGNAISYLRGQATGCLLDPRDKDAQVYKNFLIEHIPEFYDAGAEYPFDGISVKPYQDTLLVPISEPVFSPQSTQFNGSTSSLDSLSLSTPGSNNGIISLWFNNSLDWSVDPSFCLLDIRVGATSAIYVLSYSLGRLGIYAYGSPNTSGRTTPTGTCSQSTWHHLLMSFKSGVGAFSQLYVDGVDISDGDDLSSSTMVIDTGNITQVAIGSTVTGSRVLSGDIAYPYINLQESLDLSIQANREKFILDGAPVYLGANGEVPTGNTPAIFCDGGASMQNFGNGGMLVGVDLTNGSTPMLP